MGPLQLAVGRAHVGLHDLRIARDLLVRPFGQHGPALQHRDAVGDGGDDFHVVLHHEDRAAGRHLLDELRDAVHVLVAHALRGLVEQHQLGLHRQRRGDLQRALAAVRQVDGDLVGQVGKAHLREQLARPAVEVRQAALAFPEMERRAQAALQAEAHVLGERQVREHGRYLKRADHPAPGDLRRRLAGDVRAIEGDGAGRGFEELGQQVEAGGLARAVGADQRMDGTAAHRQVHIAHRGEALEFLGEMAGFENDVVAHGAGAAPWWAPPARRARNGGACRGAGCGASYAAVPKARNWDKCLCINA